MRFVYRYKAEVLLETIAALRIQRVQLNATNVGSGKFMHKISDFKCGMV